MKTYEIVLAYDVPCYAAIKVEAETPEEAARLALRKAEEEDVSFQPEWDAAGDIRIACDPEECELPEEPKPYGGHGEPQQTTYHTHTRWNGERFEDYSPEETGAATG